ncbi:MULTISPECIES: hypothetical protein [Dietzia]|jgi:hypothetical protein|uniref:Uncharacterized protein n=2 Tax=Dietzia TaxID=37914 RepID=A0A4R3ZLG1_9ACTN|nr:MULTISPECIES: hypothetical protein [Dietzia]KZO60461.1 hypothetical protein A2U19_01435 [Dietzia maris]MBB1022158.1 hypothetical protein [Dietzia sp. E1]MBC7307193.1 hypothetical protein [Dietzia sp.]MCT1641234.1 hypothetical protein [Dietzia cinnamea]MCT2077614.1 hypothetical protein [Dietzia cinnamea]
MTAKPGTLLDAFTLETDRGPIEAEIRLMHAEDGTEMLWHYENDHLGFVHPARRCVRCNEIITAAAAGGCCIACVDGLVIGHD